MSDIDDIRYLADLVDDHNWWLGELDQYNLPPAYLEYFLAVKPSTVTNSFGDSDDMQDEIDDLERQLEDAQYECNDYERAAQDLEAERDDLQEENESMSKRIVALEDERQDLKDEIAALNRYIDQEENRLD